MTGLSRALPLLALAALPLGGCAAGLAVGAVGAAVRAADRPDPPPKEDPGPAARAACTARAARAAQHGEVRIIDTVYRSPARLVVWGSVETAGGRRSFQCRWDGKIVGFTLREVEARR